MREQIYAIEPEFLLTYLETIGNVNDTHVKLAAQMFPSGADDDDDDDDIDDIYSLDGDVAHIAISGPMSASGPTGLDILFGYGGTSYKAIIGALDRAESDASVKSVVLDMDTPGGELAGCDDVWQKLSSLSKPTAAINRGILASAGYYIASAAGKINGTSPGVLTGSIGCVIVGWDDSKAAAAEGYRKVSIVSRNAPKKMAGVDTAAGRDVLQERVDAEERVMFSRIAKGRGITMDSLVANYGQGAVLVAQDPDPSKPSALKAGMLDSLVSPFPVKPTPNTESIFSRHESPASAGTSQEEVKPMTFDEFLKENPDARARYEQLIAVARTEGAAAAQARAQKVGKILASEAYAKNTIVKSKAIAALEGTITMEAFDGIVAMADMLTEQATQAAAEADTNAAGESPAQQHDGKPRAWKDEDIKAMGMDDYVKLSAEDLGTMTQAQLLLLEKRVAEIDKEAS